MEEDIKKILAMGVLAPSGGNSQPWRFRLHGNTLEVIALPEKDHPILNFRNRGTWIAHGMLLENILIASKALGYKADYSIFPDGAQPNLTVRVVFEKGTPQEEPLYEAIPKRATNRKPYKLEPLTEKEKASIVNVAKNDQGIEMHMIEGGKALATVGAAASVGELVMFEDKTLHRLLVHEIAWTEEEEAKKKSGLLLKTMELAPPQQFALKHLLRHWPIMNLFNQLGMARTIAKDNAKAYASAAAMVALAVPDTDAAFFAVGRVMERLWLEAARIGLDLQLMTGVLFMYQRIAHGDSFGLSQKHINLIEDAYRTLASEFGATGTIALLFRIGKGEPPSGYSLKNPPTFIA